MSEFEVDQVLNSVYFFADAKSEECCLRSFEDAKQVMNYFHGFTRMINESQPLVMETNFFSHLENLFKKLHFTIVDGVEVVEKAMPLTKVEGEKTIWFGEYGCVMLIRPALNPGYFHLSLLCLEGWSSRMINSSATEFLCESEKFVLLSLAEIYDDKDNFKTFFENFVKLYKDRKDEEKKKKKQQDLQNSSFIYFLAVSALKNVDAVVIGDLSSNNPKTLTASVTQPVSNNSGKNVVTVAAAGKPWQSNSCSSGTENDECNPSQMKNTVWKLLKFLIQYELSKCDSTDIDNEDPFFEHRSPHHYDAKHAQAAALRQVSWEKLLIRFDYFNARQYLNKIVDYPQSQLSLPMFMRRVWLIMQHAAKKAHSLSSKNYSIQEFLLTSKELLEDINSKLDAEGKKNAGLCCLPSKPIVDIQSEYADFKLHISAYMKRFIKNDSNNSAVDVTEKADKILKGFQTNEFLFIDFDASIGQIITNGNVSFLPTLTVTPAFVEDHDNNSGNVASGDSTLIWNDELWKTAFDEAKQWLHQIVPIGKEKKKSADISSKKTFSLFVLTQIEEFLFGSFKKMAAKVIIDAKYHDDKNTTASSTEVKPDSDNLTIVNMIMYSDILVEMVFLYMSELAIYIHWQALATQQPGASKESLDTFGKNVSISELRTKEILLVWCSVIMIYHMCRDIYSQELRQYCLPLRIESLEYICLSSRLEEYLLLCKCLQLDKIGFSSTRPSKPIFQLSPPSSMQNTIEFAEQVSKNHIKHKYDEYQESLMKKKEKFNEDLRLKKENIEAKKEEVNNLISQRENKQTENVWLMSLFTEKANEVTKTERELKDHQYKLSQTEVQIKLNNDAKEAERNFSFTDYIEYDEINMHQESICWRENTFENHAGQILWKIGIKLASIKQICRDQTNSEYFKLYLKNEVIPDNNQINQSPSSSRKYYIEIEFSDKKYPGMPQVVSCNSQSNFYNSVIQNEFSIPVTFKRRPLYAIISDNSLKVNVSIRRCDIYFTNEKIERLSAVNSECEIKKKEQLQTEEQLKDKLEEFTEERDSFYSKVGQYGKEISKLNENISSLKNEIHSLETKKLPYIVVGLPNNESKRYQILYFMNTPPLLANLSNMCLTAELILIPHTPYMPRPDISSYTSKDIISKLAVFENTNRKNDTAQDPVKFNWIEFFKQHHDDCSQNCNADLRKEFFSTNIYLGGTKEVKPPSNSINTFNNATNTVAFVTSADQMMWFPDVGEMNAFWNFPVGGTVTSQSFNINPPEKNTKSIYSVFFENQSLENIKCMPIDPFKRDPKWTREYLTDLIPIRSNSLISSKANEKSSLQSAMYIPLPDEEKRKRGNFAIANQHQTPNWLGKREYFTFYEMRSGAYLQMQMLLNALKEKSLPFDCDETLCLIRQLLYHVGEISWKSGDNSNSNQRLAHDHDGMDNANRNLKESEPYFLWKTELLSQKPHINNNNSNFNSSNEPMNLSRSNFLLVLEEEIIKKIPTTSKSINCLELIIQMLSYLSFFDREWSAIQLRNLSGNCLKWGKELQKQQQQQQQHSTQKQDQQNETDSFSNLYKSREALCYIYSFLSIISINDEAFNIDDCKQLIISLAYLKHNLLFESAQAAEKSNSPSRNVNHLQEGYQFCQMKMISRSKFIQNVLLHSDNNLNQNGNHKFHEILSAIVSNVAGDDIPLDTTNWHHSSKMIGCFHSSQVTHWHQKQEDTENISNIVISKGNIYSLNIYSGEILVNASSLKRLPSTVTDKESYQLLFGGINLEVEQINENHWITSKTIDSCKYEFRTYVNSENEELLTICEIDTVTNAKYQFLDNSSIWGEELYLSLRENYFHWLVLAPSSLTHSDINRNSNINNINNSTDHQQKLIILRLRYLDDKRIQKNNNNNNNNSNGDGRKNIHYILECQNHSGNSSNNLNNHESFVCYDIPEGLINCSLEELLRLKNNMDRLIFPLASEHSSLSQIRKDVVSKFEGFDFIRYKLRNNNKSHSPSTHTKEQVVILEFPRFQLEFALSLRGENHIPIWKSLEHKGYRLSSNQQMFDMFIGLPNYLIIEKDHNNDDNCIQVGSMPENFELLMSVDYVDENGESSVQKFGSRHILNYFHYSYTPRLNIFTAETIESRLYLCYCLIKTCNSIPLVSRGYITQTEEGLRQLQQCYKTTPYSDGEYALLQSISSIARDDIVKLKVESLLRSSKQTWYMVSSNADEEKRRLLEANFVNMSHSPNNYQYYQYDLQSYEPIFRNWRYCLQASEERQLFGHVLSSQNQNVQNRSCFQTRQYGNISIENDKLIQKSLNNGRSRFILAAVKKWESVLANFDVSNMNSSKTNYANFPLLKDILGDLVKTELGEKMFTELQSSWVEFMKTGCRISESNYNSYELLMPFVRNHAKTILKEVKEYIVGLEDALFKSSFLVPLNSVGEDQNNRIENDNDTVFTL